MKASEDAKKINAYFRKHGTVVGCPVLPESDAKRMQAELDALRERCPFHDVPFPSYELTSMRGRIKRLQDRLGQLARLQSIREGDSDIDFEGGRIVRNADLNRLQILFDDIPDESTRAELKAHGFRWSPRNEAWQRQLTDNAIAAAKDILKI